MNNPLGKHPVITSITVLIVGLLIWGFWPQPVFVEAIEAKRAPLHYHHRGRGTYPCG